MLSPESGEKYAQIKHRNSKKTVLNIYVGGFRCERTRYYEFWTGILTKRDSLMLKCLNDDCVYYKHACELLVEY